MDILNGIMNRMPFSAPGFILVIVIAALSGAFSWLTQFPFTNRTRTQLSVISDLKAAGLLVEATMMTKAVSRRVRIRCELEKRLYQLGILFTHTMKITGLFSVLAVCSSLIDISTKMLVGNEEVLSADFFLELVISFSLMFLAGFVLDLICYAVPRAMRWIRNQVRK